MIMKRNIFKIILLLSVLLGTSCNTDEQDNQVIGPNALTEEQKEYLSFTLIDANIDIAWDEMNCPGDVTFTFNQVNQNFTEPTNSDLSGLFAFIQQNNGVTVTYEDIIVISVNIQFQGGSLDLENREALNDYFEDCVYNGTSDNAGPINSIPCLQLTLPITIFVYDITSESFEELTFSTEESLLSALFQNTDSQLLELNYPIVFLHENGNSITVNSNDELQNVLEAANAECGTGN